MGLSPGDKVDRYKVLELLGSGGMGQVYRARDLKLERPIALKVLRADAGASKGGVASLLREARAIAALSHPNVLAVYDVGEVHDPEELRGLPYIAMELVVGQSLRASLNDPAATVAQRIEWLRDVASALEAAHEVGVVHRDMKPDNVMIRFDGVVKVLDFGVARYTPIAIDPMSSTEGHSVPTLRAGAAGLGGEVPEGPPQTSGAVVGTPFYMSPEQLRGEPLDGRADQFSWGVTAYEVLARAAPWRKTDNGATLITEILYDDPPPLGSRAPDVPEEIAAIVARAMAKLPEDRFASMRDVIKALAPFVATAPSKGERAAATAASLEPPAASGSGERDATGRQPSRWLLVSGAIASLALVAAVTLVVRAKRAAPAPRLASSGAPAGATPLPCLPAAQKLYDDGLVVFETAGNDRARRMWLDAAAIDPACAPARLRAALTLEESGIPISDARSWYIGARDHEDHLTEVERAIAEAALPHFAADASDAAAFENLRALGERYPSEPFVFYLAGVLAANLGRADEARVAFQKTIAVRPKYQTAYALLGYLATTSEERAQWSVRCLAETPHSTWCHALRADELEEGHDCAAFERFARDYVATDPGRGAQVRLTEALLAAGAPKEAVVEANGLSDDRSGWRAARNEALYGDYAPIEKWLRETDETKKPDFAMRATRAYQLSMVLDDTGRRGEADALVRSTSLASRAMSPASSLAIAHFYERALQAGVMTRAEAERVLAADPATGTSVEWTFKTWLALARLSRASAEARDALARMPPKPMLSTSSQDEGSMGPMEADLARLYALAGNWQAARREAESAVTRCDANEWPLGVVRAYALLGEACEKTGDVAGARAAYETVVRRWGKLAPRAVHAEHARERLAALGR